MCGRFVLYSSGETVAEAFALAAVPELQPRYNIAPSQLVAKIRTCPNDR
jgi:putative SOS response-associated peptidase YedK